MLGQIIQKARKNNNLTQIELAKLMNRNESYICLLENNYYKKIEFQDYSMLKLFLPSIDNNLFIDEYVYKTIDYGTIIKNKRLALGLSYRDMERLTIIDGKPGISKMQCHRIENGMIKFIREETFFKLDHVLDLNRSIFEDFIEKTNDFKIKFINDGSFGILAKEKRLAMKLIQKELSIITGITVKTISGIENLEKQQISTSTFLKLSNALEFDDNQKNKYSKKIKVK